MNLPQSKFQEPTTSKSLKGFKLWRTSNLTFSKTSLKLHTKKQWLGLSLRIIEYPTNEYKTFSYTFRIDQIPFTYGERKKERLNFPRIFSLNLLISAAFTTILKMKPTQCNAIRVHTALASEPSRDKCPLETYYLWNLKWARRLNETNMEECVEITFFPSCIFMKQNKQNLGNHLHFLIQKMSLLRWDL